MIARKKCKLMITSPTLWKKLAGGIYVESVCNLKIYCDGKVCSALLEHVIFQWASGLQIFSLGLVASEQLMQTVGRLASGLMRLRSGRSESGVGCSNQINPTKQAVINVMCRRTGECVWIGLGLEVVLHCVKQVVVASFEVTRLLDGWVALRSAYLASKTARTPSSRFTQSSASVLDKCNCRTVHSALV